MKFLTDIQERRLAQILVTYCAVGWIGLEVVDQVVDRSVLPEITYRVALTLFLTLLPAAAIIAWFHGEKGRQRATLAERWMLMGVGVFALTSTGFVVRANVIQPSAEAELELEPWEDPRRMAVLYFDSRGDAEDAQFLASGLTESLIDELSSVEALHVISRHGSELYQDSDVPVGEIGRTLGVGTLVSGRIEMAGERLRLTVEVVEAATGEQIDAPVRIERPRGEVFELQDELAREVSLILRERVGEEIGVLGIRTGTSSVEAWELLSRATVAAAKAEDLSDDGHLEAASRKLLQEDSLLVAAEAADPDWVEPTVRRGWAAYRQARLGGFDRRHYVTWIDRGLEHAERALTTAPEHSRALELKATLLYLRYMMNLADDHDEANALVHDAERLFEAAVNEDPTNASAWTSLSHLRALRGKLPEARLAARVSYEADPYLSNANLTLWRLTSLAWDGQDSIEAERWCDEGLRRFPDDYRFHQCKLMLFALPDYPTDVEEAWRWQQSWTEHAPHSVRAINEKKSLVYMSMSLARAGLPDSARAVAARSRADAGTDPLRELPRLEAMTRLWLGDPDEATRLLAIYLATNPNRVRGYQHAIEEGTMPWFYNGLEEHQPFRALVGRH